MYLPRFMIERPESPEEAATLLKVRKNSHLVAGGTELFPQNEIRPLLSGDHH